MTVWPNKSMETNRRQPCPLDTEHEFGSAVCTPWLPSAAVAHLFRWAKKKFTLSTVLLAIALAAAGHAAERPRGKLTFIRPGDNGFLNIMPATIVIEGQRSFSLSGECTNAVELPYGQYRFYVESPDPYNHSATAKKWRTGMVEVHVGSVGATFLIEGARMKEGYDHWNVRKQSNQPDAVVPAMTPQLHYGSQWRGVTDLER